MKKIFLSYGHKEHSIVRLIRDHLIASGFEVWIDESEIKEGDDWRTKIVQGILESQSVIGCLSKYSVRDPGVCLDELSISVGYRYANIVTVLLEAESEVKVPSSVSNIQWIDMSMWKTEMSYVEGNHLQTNPWFEGKMQILKNILHSKDTEKYIGEIEQLKNALIYADVRMGKLQYLQKKDFVGRLWLNDKIQSWIKNSTDKICVIYGAPGSGKSAFLAHHMHFNSQFAGGVFCESGLGNLSDARTIVCTLAFLLACRISNFRVLLLHSLIRINNWELLSAEEMFQIVFEECLSHSIDGGQETILLAIDGLNECGEESGRHLANTLLKYTSRLPKWIRFIITSRKEYYVQEPLKNCFHIDIDEMTKENSEDVRLYLCKSLSKADVTEAEIAYLVKKAEGIFQYAEIIAELIKNKKIAIKDLGNVPSRLDDIFHLWFSSYFNNKEYNNISPAIGIILAVQAPIPETELKKIMNWKQRDLSSFKRVMGPFLITEKNIYDNELSDMLDISSLYLRIWLSNHNISGIYAVYPEDGKDLLAEYFLKGLKDETLSNYGLLYGIELVYEKYPEYQEKVVHSRYVYDKIKEFFQTTDKQHHYGSFREPLFKLISYMHDSGKLNAFIQEDISNEDGNMALVTGMFYTIFRKPMIAVGYWKMLIDLWEKWIKRGEMFEDDEWIKYAIILEDMASACRNIFNDKQAEKYYLQALEIFRKFEASDSTEKLAELAECYFGFAGFIQQRNNLLNNEYYCNMAKRMYRRAARIYEKLVKSRLDDYGVFLSSTYSDFACLFDKVGDWENAKEYFDKAHELLKKLFQSDNDRYEIKLAILKGAIGCAYANHHNHLSALKMFQNAELLIEAHNSQLTIEEQEKVSVLYHNYAAILEEMKINDKKSEDLTQKSLHLQKHLIDNDFLSNAVNYLATSSSYAVRVAEQGNGEEAEFWLNETLRTADKIQGVNHNLDFVLAVSFVNAGTAYLKLGNKKEKKVCYRKALEICNRHSEKIFAELARNLR